MIYTYQEFLNESGMKGGLWYLKSKEDIGWFISTRKKEPNAKPYVATVDKVDYEMLAYTKTYAELKPDNMFKDLYKYTFLEEGDREEYEVGYESFDNALSKNKINGYGSGYAVLRSKSGDIEIVCYGTSGSEETPDGAVIIFKKNPDMGRN